MNTIKKLRVFFLFFLIYGIYIPVWADNTDPDPYKNFNRSAFAFNEKLDKWVLKPAAETYLAVTPEFLVRGIHNAFNNIAEIPSTANDILQFNWYQALSDGWRFFFNSTAGLGGFFDIAQHMDLPAHYTDFGLTLVRWGYHQSNYLVLPFFGPGSVRDIWHIPVDNYLFTIYYLLPTTVGIGIYAANVIDVRADLLHYQGVIEQLSFDPYIFQRNAWQQKRQQQIDQTLHPASWREQAKQFNESHKPALIKLYYYQAGGQTRLFS